MSAVRSKVRLYDLAKDLRVDTKRLIQEVRSSGIDVSVPSNSISKELADKIRDKYSPKKLARNKRAIKLLYKPLDGRFPAGVTSEPRTTKLQIETIQFKGPLPRPNVHGAVGQTPKPVRTTIPIATYVSNSNPIAATHRYDTVAGPSAETPPLKKEKIRRCPLCPFEMTTKSERRRHFISDHPEEVLGGKLLSSLKARELCDLIPAKFGDLASAATLAGFALRKESDEVSAQLLEKLVRHVRLAKEKPDALRATTMMDLDRFDELAQRDFGVVRKLIDDCLKGRPIQKGLESFATEDANVLMEYTYS